LVELSDVLISNLWLIESTLSHRCPVVRNNRIAASQATQLVDNQLGVPGKALLDNHVPSGDNSQE